MRTRPKGYIHGYDSAEQKRLVAQAKYLEPWVYPGIDFCRALKVLEVGCGVGAQTKVLLKHFPQLTIDAVDVSETQLDQARVYLAKEIEEGRVRLFRADGRDMSVLKGRRYDGAFMCWFLEHVPEPLKVLEQTRKLLKRGSPVFLSEVFNQAVFMAPPSPVFAEYWRHFNDLQSEIGGHPFIGACLGGILKEAGYKKISTELRSLHFDSRDPKARRVFSAYLEELMLSGAPALLQSRRVEPESVRALRSEFKRMRKAEDSVLYLGFFRALGYA